MLCIDQEIFRKFIRIIQQRILDCQQIVHLIKTNSSGYIWNVPNKDK